jgi:hypothetical protein
MSPLLTWSDCSELELLAVRLTVYPIEGYAQRRRRLSLFRTLNGPIATASIGASSGPLAQEA